MSELVGQGRGSARQRLEATLLAGAVVALLALFLPYILHNELQGGDAVGHLHEARFLAAHAPLELVAWNPDVFCGYPAGLMYPPLSQALVAIGASAGVEALVFKVLLCAAAVAALLLGAALPRRSGGKLGLLGAGLVALILGFPARLWGIERAMGVNVESGIDAGMLAAAMGFVFFLAALVELRKTAPQARRAILWTTLALLSHLVAGLVTWFIWGLALLRALPWPGPTPRGAGRQGFLAAGGRAITLLLVPGGLAGLYLVPMMAGASQMVVDPVGLEWNPVPIALIAAGLLAMTLRRRVPASGLALIGLVGLAGGAAALEAPTHLYRLSPYVLLLAGLTIVDVLDGARLGRLRLGLGAVLVVVGAAGLSLSPLSPRGNPRMEVDAGRFPAVAGRVFTLAPLLHSPGMMALPLLVQAATGLPVDNGISIESAPNARYIFYTKARLSAVFPVWTSFLPERRGDMAFPEFARRLDALGFAHVLTDVRLDEVLPGASFTARHADVLRYPNALGVPPGGVFDVSPDGGSFRYALHTLGSPEPALALSPRTLFRASEPPRESADAWFETLDPERRPVHCRELPAWEEALGPTPVALHRVDDEHIILDVSSDRPVPVLVRESFHPFWRAYQEGPAGERHPVPICETAPRFMIVPAAGRLHLVFDKGPVHLGFALSGLVLLLAIVHGLRRRRAPRAQRCSSE